MLQWARRIWECFSPRAQLTASASAQLGAPPHSTWLAHKSQPARQFPASCRNINVLEKSLLPLASSLWSHKGLHRGWTGCYIRREEFLLSIPLGWSSLVSHCFLKVLWHGYIRYRHLYAVGISSSKDSPCRILPLPSLSLIYPPE